MICTKCSLQISVPDILIACDKKIIFVGNSVDWSDLIKSSVVKGYKEKVPIIYRDF